MARMHLVATTYKDRQNTIMTLQALEGMADAVNGPRKPAIRVQHDRTVPPMGATVAASIEPTDDGNYRLLAEYDVFPDPVPVTLPNGEEALEQHSDKQRFPFATATFSACDSLSVGIDQTNFESFDAFKQYFDELRDEVEIPFKESHFGRKALLNDPELIITLGVKTAAIWLAVRAGTGVAKAVSDIAADETKKLYQIIRAAIIRYASYAIPKNRPVTYVVQVPGTPNLEFVARSSDPNTVIKAITDNSFASTYEKVAALNDAFSTEFIQFILTDTGEWHFNHLLTKDGATIGTRESFGRRAVLLNNMARIAAGEQEQEADTGDDAV